MAGDPTGALEARAPLLRALLPQGARLRRGHHPLRPQSNAALGGRCPAAGGGGLMPMSPPRACHRHPPPCPCPAGGAASAQRKRRATSPLQHDAHRFPNLHLSVPQAPLVRPETGACFPPPHPPTCPPLLAARCWRPCAPPWALTSMHMAMAIHTHTHAHTHRPSSERAPSRRISSF